MSNAKIWKGDLTFILAAAGSAVGLGNIWKFPYMVGSNGGSAFVIVYLFCKRNAVQMAGHRVLSNIWGPAGALTPIAP